MLSATNQLIDTLLGSILPAWLSLDFVQYLLGIVLFACVCTYILRVLKIKK